MSEIKPRIHIKYGSKGDISQALLGEIRNVVAKHGELSEQQWVIRGSVIDLVTVLEIIGVFFGLKIREKDTFTYLLKLP